MELRCLRGEGRGGGKREDPDSGRALAARLLVSAAGSDSSSRERGTGPLFAGGPSRLGADGGRGGWKT